MNIIELEHFIHPRDEKFMKQIYNFSSVQAVSNKIFDDDLDAVNEYVYSSSYAKLPENHFVNKYLAESCEIFGVNKIPKAYIFRSYDFDIKCSGYSRPVILIPTCLIERNDKEIIRIRLLSVVASIKAEHHKVLFLLWLIENTGGTINKFHIDKILDGYLCEWKRSSTYTLDRAALIATDDYELALKNILYGKVPFDIFKSFHFDIDNDTFSNQTEAFYENKSLMDIASKAYSFFQFETWLPDRYEELRNFYLNSYKG